MNNDSVVQAFQEFFDRVQELVEKITAFMDALPDEKEVERQRSRDDLQAKRRQQRGKSRHILPGNGARR